MSGGSAVDAVIEVVPYDASWPKRFAAERDQLAPLLAPWLTGEIEHVGSTAVPGLLAKPVIDILAPVADLEDCAAIIAALTPIGYLYHPYRAEQMHWFCKPAPGFRTHHLHVVPRDSAAWRERLGFRDALRGDLKLAVEYAWLKLALAARHRHDREAYSDAKTPFIHAALRRQAGGSSL
jgi:GrpB-like predicted nucleotidyltransferase (UPF0157 family)